MNVWSREAVLAIRRLRRAPTFSITVVVVFASAIAISAAVGSLAATVQREAVPFGDVDRLVNLHEYNESQGNEYMQSSWPTFEFWQRESTVFEEVGVATAPSNLTLAGDDGGERVIGGLVSPGVFRVLGVDPILGRAFGVEEEGVGTAARSVVLDHAFWTRQFGADPEILGSSLNINGSNWTVVGVLPPGVPLLPTEPSEVEVWLPAAHAEVAFGVDISQVHTFRVFTTLARVREGIPRERVEEEVQVISDRLAELYPETSGYWAWSGPPLRDVVTQDLRGPTLTLLAGALVLLLVAITNVTGLFFQRARSRVKGAAVRLAIGGSRTDLIRIATAEAGVLVGLGAALGVAGGFAAVRSHATWTPFPLPAHVDLAMDPRAVVLAGVLAVVTVLFAGRATGWWWWRHGESGRAGAHRGGGRAMWRATRLGVGAQVTMAAMLTVTALLTGRSFQTLSSAHVGFDAANLLYLRADVPTDLRPTDELSRTSDEILAVLEQLPGVRKAVLWSPHVPGDAGWNSRVAVFDRSDLQEPGDQPLVRIHQVGHEAAGTIGMAFAAGRDFTLADRTSGRRVAIVSETAAREWWGDGDPLGRQIRRWNHDVWSEVVGVVRDAPLSGRQGAAAEGGRDVMFLHDQDPQAFLVFLLRTTGEPGSLVREAQSAVRAIAPDLPLYSVRYMSDLVREQEELPRSTALLGAMFAAAALMLVAVGLYGTLSNTVTERAAEISLRKALGASSVVILRQVTLSTFGVIAVGAGAGVATARFLLPRLLGDTLFRVSATDASLYVLAVGLLIVVTIPALLQAAWRGSRRNPVEALRGGAGA